VESNGGVLLSLDGPATLGGTFARGADLVLKSGATFSLAFDAGLAGIPPHVGLDAAARLGGKLLLSFDVAFQLGPLFIRPADVVEFDGATPVRKVLDASALGLPAQSNVDALHAVTADRLLVSFDTGGRIAGADLAFSDEDVLAFVPSGPTWSLHCAMLSRSARWGPLDLDALSATVGGDALFNDGFEQEPGP
jgi:hypothetical protein